MMQSNVSHLYLNRLVVMAYNNAIAYDETFHHGVNIIRGNNSSGKSTISNFIFYILGGDYSSWTTEALKCKDVIAEVELNGAVITLKRNIVKNSMQPMNIYWGNYEESRKDSVNWQTYPYKQTSNLVSYTNVLFKTLSFPEVKSDSDSNITIHQLLRLMYIDQDSPPQNLFRIERFDLPLTRQAISELLLGIYDDTLYNQRLELRTTQRANDDKKRELDSLSRVYAQTSGQSLNIETIKKDVEATKKELISTDTLIKKLKGQSKVKTTKKTESTFEKVQTELTEAKNQLHISFAKVNEYEVDIFDSNQFISTLNKRLVELNHSLLTRKILGELPLTHCPQCLSPLDVDGVEGHCSLCKKPISEEAERANAKRLIQEMELQVKESQSLLEEKKRKLAELNGELPLLTERARVLQKQLDDSIDANQTTRDERIDALLVKKGGLEKKIEFFASQIQIIEVLEQLKKELAELAKKIKLLKLDIFTKEQEQENKLQTAMRKITENTLIILQNDLDRQNEFKTGRSVEVDFLKDSYMLDGNNNFSASSKVYFKNAVLFSIFFASLELGFFRYPRFILCDNMEDKGMEKARTQNFQKVITTMSQKYGINHQIIFTTSMIDDELNNTDYCVGAEYNINNKTLKV